MQGYRPCTPLVDGIIYSSADKTSGNGVDGRYEGVKQTLAVVNTIGLHTVFSGLLNFDETRCIRGIHVFMVS